MSDLHKKKCVSCDGSIPPFELSEIHKYLKKVDGWDVKKNKDESFFIEKEFKFKNFLESQNFSNKVLHIFRPHRLNQLYNKLQPTYVMLLQYIL